MRDTCYHGGPPSGAGLMPGRAGWCDIAATWLAALFVVFCLLTGLSALTGPAPALPPGADLAAADQAASEAPAPVLASLLPLIRLPGRLPDSVFGH